MNQNTPRRIAVLIGWDRYENFPELRTPLKDVAAMAELLRDPSIGDDELRAVRQETHRRDAIRKSPGDLPFRRQGFRVLQALNIPNQRL